MTGKELYDLYLTGVPIHIQFEEDIEELDLQFEKGMYAIITEMHKDQHSEDLYEMNVDESFYRKVNLSLEKPININPDTKNYDLKWSEKYNRTDTELLFVDEKYDISNFKVIKNSFNDLILDFQKSDETSYIDWLQEQLCYYKQLYDKTN